MGDGVPVAAAVVAGALLLAVGGLVPYVVFRAASGGLRRNGWAGLRTPGTLGSDTAWRAGHAAAMGWVGASGAAFALGGLGALVAGALGASTSAFAGVVVGALVVGTVLTVVGSVRADAVGRAVSRGSGRRGGG